MDNSFFTAKQVQELLHVDRTTIYRMLKDGRLTGVKVGHHWRFSSREVNELIIGATRPANLELPGTEASLPLHCIQPVQDVFAELAEVGSLTADRNGQPLTRVSNTCDFCRLILESKLGRHACILSWRKLAEQKDVAPEFALCHAGLQYARARIEAGDELLAILVAGQFYLDTPEPEEENKRLLRLAKTYHIDYDLIQKAAQKIPVLEPRKAIQISGWLEKVAHTFEEISVERGNLIGRLRQIAAMSVIEP